MSIARKLTILGALLLFGCSNNSIEIHNGADDNASGVAGVLELARYYSTNKVKEKNIQELFLKVWNLTLDFKKVNFYHIAREKNKVADKLVNEALDRQEKQGSLL